MSYSLFLDNTDGDMLKWSHFFPIYERHLGQFVNRSVRLLEVGVRGGGSLRYWKKWLGPRAKIIGAGIDESCRCYSEPQINVEIGDQADKEFVERLTEKHGPFDIVIDDGSHNQRDVQTTFDILYPRLDERGVYIVEDTEHSYYPSQGGGVKVEGSFVERAKCICDLLNGQAWQDDRHLLQGQDLYTRKTLSVSFYASMIVFERGFYGTDHLYFENSGRSGSSYHSNVHRRY